MLLGLAGGNVLEQNHDFAIDLGRIGAEGNAVAVAMQHVPFPMVWVSRKDLGDHRLHAVSISGGDGGRYILAGQATGGVAK